jgi:hypothetical protein
MRVLLAIALLATAASADPAVPARDLRVAAAIPDRGDPDPAVRASSAAEPAAPAAIDARHHAIYLELGGRAGLWGVGYDWQPHPRLAVGAAASYYSFDGDHITTLAPYLAAYPLGLGRHRAFVQLGPTLSRRTTPSPVPEWNGLTTTKLTAEAGGGYEYRNGVLARLYVMASKGDHLVPWFGASFGWTL